MIMIFNVFKDFEIGDDGSDLFSKGSFTLSKNECECEFFLCSLLVLIVSIKLD